MSQILAQGSHVMQESSVERWCIWKHAASGLSWAEDFLKGSDLYFSFWFIYLHYQNCFIKRIKGKKITVRFGKT